VHGTSRCCELGSAGFAEVAVALITLVIPVGICGITITELACDSDFMEVEGSPNNDAMDQVERHEVSDYFRCPADCNIFEVS
jgi:hypothetical protein